jgi:altronate dehydratase small subunit
VKDPGSKPAAASEAAGALVLHPHDNVATALRDLAPGETIGLQGPSHVLTLKVIEPVALCHKIALQALEPGQSARKYGEVIGTVSQAIGMGCHVHVHNLKSDRAQIQPPAHPSRSG